MRTHLFLILCFELWLFRFYLIWFCFVFLDLLKRPSYPCPNDSCSKSYKRKCTLNRHLHYECGKPPMYKCPYCTHKCSLKCNMNKHMFAMHRTTQVNESDLTTEDNDEFDESYFVNARMDPEFTYSRSIYRRRSYGARLFSSIQHHE